MSAVVLREPLASRARKSWTILLLVVPIIAGSSGASMASEESILVRYSGRFELADMEAAQAERDRSAREVAEVFPAPLRKMAIGKMKKAASIFPFVELRAGDGSVTIRSDESAGWATTLDKKEEEFRAKDGKKFLLSRWMEDGVLHSRARGETGTRSAKFRLSDGGDVLTVVTTIQLDRSERPIVYSATYKRTQTLGN